jgi:dTDP-4-dehydrorhamnose 3,5-epimerase
VRFSPTPIPGAVVVEPEPRADERGFFARTFCVEEFRAHNLNPRLVQCNVSFNRQRGTLRGLHWQAAPREEAKLVRCTHGAILDVIVDLRPDSPAFRKWFSVELLTLVDDTEVFYQMSEYFAPECARGVRWDDPAFGIVWPDGEKIIHPRDAAYPDFTP